MLMKIIKNQNDLKKELFHLIREFQGEMHYSDFDQLLVGLFFLKFVCDDLDESRKIHFIHPEENSENTKTRKAAFITGTFLISTESDWSEIKNNSMKPDIGTVIGKIMRSIIKENEHGKRFIGILPTGIDYEINLCNIYELIEKISSLTSCEYGEEVNGHKDLITDILWIGWGINQRDSVYKLHKSLYKLREKFGPVSEMYEKSMKLTNKKRSKDKNI